MSERRLIAVEGTVQGVGFRPFVYRLATAFDLRGSVRNDAAGVLIDAEGESASLDAFVRALSAAPPPLAVVDRVHHEPAVPRAVVGFAIASSEDAPAETGRQEAAASVALITADAAICDACRDELFDPGDRRYRYPFLNCTHCGPRLTIVRGVPYDRMRTTMASFGMCPACRREYDDPDDRRFHAQPIACEACGPRVELRAAQADRGTPPTGDAAIAAAVAALLHGRIVAVKGIGGYHLACDATNAVAVRRLRTRKCRESKPFAVMVADLDAARALVHVEPGAAALLRSPECPIVLLPTLALDAPATRRVAGVVDEVAPRNDHLGVILAYTPLHHLLLDGVDRPLVMTSGNRTGEPIAFTDDDALTQLGGIADVFLVHDRAIAMRCDDSVVRVLAQPDGTRGAAFVRRSRGYAPRPIRLATACRGPVLGVGGHLKNTFCLTRGRSAFLSHHVGDLESEPAYRALREAIDHYGRLFDLRPEVVAHDLHPDYLSTRLAAELAVGERVAVQHHHAHVAACVAEHGVTEPVIGVAFDGAGLGTDGAIWGGEFLLADGASCERLAHLGYVPLPGGDAAARHPWRVAAAHLQSAFGGLERLPIPFGEGVDPAQWSLVRQILHGGPHSPPTSSVGRLFDAAAALVGLRHSAEFEGQAAMEIETVADPDTTRSYPVDLRETAQGWIIDTAPLIRALTADVAAGRAVAEIAGAFHNGVRDLLLRTVQLIAARTGIRRVALTGGVFQNALLSDRSVDALVRHGFQVLVHRRVPCNDGGLSLGQAYVAGRIMERRACA